MSNKKETLRDIKIEISTPLSQEKQVVDSKNKKIKEINGPRGLEPTRYGDWEANGRCHDF